MRVKINPRLVSEEMVLLLSIIFDIIEVDNEAC